MCVYVYVCVCVCVFVCIALGRKKGMKPHSLAVDCPQALITASKNGRIDIVRMLLDPQSACGVVCGGFVKGRNVRVHGGCKRPVRVSRMHSPLDRSVRILAMLCERPDHCARASAQVQMRTDKTKMDGRRSCGLLVGTVLFLILCPALPWGPCQGLDASAPSSKRTKEGHATRCVRH